MEGIAWTEGKGAGYTLATCKSACEQDGDCVAIDFYTATKWCNLYDQANSTPTRIGSGASSYV